MQMAEGMSDEEKIFTYKGVLYPSIMCPEETLKRLDSIQAREDDVMLVAYPKCGECRDLRPLALTQLSSMKMNVKNIFRMQQTLNSIYSISKKMQFKNTCFVRSVATLS